MKDYHELSTPYLVRRYAAIHVRDAVSEFGISNALYMELHHIVEELRRRGVLD